MLVIILLSVALVLGVLAVALGLAVATRLQALEQRVTALPSQPALAIPEPPDRPIQGLSFQLAISQDYAHGVVAELLAEELLKEDAEVGADRADILISGEVTCNGYADVYYTADIVCSRTGTPICRIIEKPPHGDRPMNLVYEILSRLKRDLSKSSTRDERKSALRELGQ